MKKKIIIISIVILLSGVCFYSFIFGNKSTSTVEVSKDKSSKDESGIDWSKYETYDVNLDSGNVNINKAGVYNINGILNDGSITVNTIDNVKLVLNGVTINSNNPGINVSNSKNCYIEIKGDNKITSNTNDALDAAIYSKSDLFLYGDGSIEINSNKDGIASKDDLTILSGKYVINSDKDGIKGRDSLCIKDGTFTIKSADGIKTTNEKKGELIIENGTFNISSSQDGIDSISSLTISSGKFEITTGGSTDKSTKGIKAEGEIIINNGTFTIDSIDDAIHSNKNVIINNGTFEISSSDDGMHADNSLTIKDEKIKIYKSHEGLEAYTINVDGGDVNITADDDGINVAGGKDSSGSEFNDNGGKLNINGGKIYINSSGDGLDSNGSIYMNFGEVYVDGPVDNGNGALDYNGEFKITGGTLIAVGSSSMAQNVSNISTQTSILVNLDSTVSGDISIGSISFSPAKKYQSILVSSSDFKSGESYTLKYGSSSQEVSLTSTVTTVGNSSGMMGGRGFGRR
ncbi:MAG: carbohydrate-binding domain-containing protein [Bacilli bacterium]|nr:carbohydrate-binding domain-containing protein [Bacilli bacterium]